MTKLMKAYQRLTSVTEALLILVTFGGPVAVYLWWLLKEGPSLTLLLMAIAVGAWLLFGFWIVAAIRKQIEERFGKESSDE